jgi:hypothetical protein
MEVKEFNLDEYRSEMKKRREIRHDWALDKQLKVLVYKGFYEIDLEGRDSPTKSSYHMVDWLIHLRRKNWFDEKCEREFLILLHEYTKPQIIGDQKC